MEKKLYCFIICVLIFGLAASSAWSQENQIQNSEFDEDFTSWVRYGAAGYTAEVVQGAGMSGKNAVLLDVTDASAGTAIGIAQDGLLLEPGVTYPIGFTARAEEDREMVMELQTNINNASWPTQLNRKVSLTTTPQTFTFEYTHNGNTLGDDATETVIMYLMLKGPFWPMQGNDLNKKVWIDRVYFGAEPPMPSLDFADDPYPEDGSTDIIRDTILSWSPGQYAGTHNVYFGESFEDVNNMTTPTVSNHDANSFDPERLEFGTTYFWRVDEVNATPDKTVYRGDVWSFEVEPYSIQIPGSEILATASSSSNAFSTPEKTVDGSGLADNDTHNIKTEDMWFTAMGDSAPWIQYEFDTVKKLDTMKVWNSNSSAEGFLGYGVNGVLIEYSKDGESWAILEDVNELSRAPGLPTYDQYDKIALNGLAAKMVRLNIQSNFGGFLKSYSLSEVQFTMIPAAARTPIPASGAKNILPNDMVSWRAGREAAQSTVYVSTDPNEVTDSLAPSGMSNTNSLDLGVFDLQMGETYYWRVDEINEAETESVWTGPVWSFSTVAALVVEDFESYGNDSPDRPFQTWLDGFGYSADEFFAVGYSGNGTGAGIGHDIWTASSLHYDGNIMETTNTLSGSNQSMPFYYGNTGNVASQTERTFTTPQDWTLGGAQTLSVAFSGTSDNTGQLYIKINNTKIVYDGDAENIARSGWQTWLVDLSGLGVTLQNVTKMTMGVDGSGAAGLVYIDDIRLLSESLDSLIPGAAIQAWETAATADAPAFLVTHCVDGVYDIGALSGDISYEFIVRSNPNEELPSMGLMGRRDFGDTSAGLKYEQWQNTDTYGATVFGVADYDFGIATSPGQDTHLVFISSEATGTTTLYVNGIYGGQIENAITLSGMTGIGYMASAEDGSTSFDNFDGNIFGVAVYDVSLAEATIAAHADAFLK